MAEEINTNVNSEPNNADPTSKQSDKPEKTLEQLYAEAKADAMRWKKSSDKNASEAADWKRQALATKSESEKAAIEKAERDAEKEERFNALLRKDTIRDYADSLCESGFDKALAARAAEALYDGNKDDLVLTIKQFGDALEKRVRADIMRSMPAPSIVNDEGMQMTQEQFDNMSYLEQVQFRRNHPQLYDKFVNG